MNRRILLTAIALLIASPVFAAPLPAPTGKVVLEVAGAITNTNADGAADFDMAMLAGLQQRTTVTASPWYDGKQSFSGPLGYALLNLVGATGTMMTVTALNDYVTEIPVGDFQNHKVILATSLNGAPMSVREKGPIFVIYPFDEEPSLNNETYYGRSAWQVKSITIH